MNALASANNATALGHASKAIGPGSTAVGVIAGASGPFCTAVGNGSIANSTSSTAVGDASKATANFSSAFGQHSTAGGLDSTAVGGNSTANFANSMALGAGASTTIANQIAIGTPANTYRLLGVTSAASLSSQAGGVSIVTSDPAGHLATMPVPPPSGNAWLLGGNTIGSMDHIGTNNAMPFIINTSGAGPTFERMRITPAGLVGIGTTTPTATLHINGTTRFSGIATLDSGTQLQAAASGGARILGEQGNTPVRPAIGFFSTNGVDDGGGGNGIFRPVANTMAFATASTERMRIVGSSVGIGTTSPTNTLDVNGQARIRVLTSSPLLNDVVVADPITGVLFTRPASTLGGGGGWLLSGNPVTSGNFLGTTLNVPLEIRVNNSRALLVEHHPQAPNIIGGSPANSVTAGVGGATIAGGGFAGQAGNGNTVTAHFGTVGGGRKNQAGNLATVGGGFINTASGLNSTVSGGTNNTASGVNSTVSGGTNNTASGVNSIVAGGQSNKAAGDSSFAAGTNAHANHKGAFVWADVVSTASPIFASTAANQFNVRATGGTSIFSNISLTNGCVLPANGTAWSCTSDREIKENFTPVDGRTILSKLNLIPISQWNLKGQGSSTRHLGPVAQDFYAAFGLGEDDKHISTIDLDGVALVSIQALYQMSSEKDKQIEALQQRIEKLEKLVGTVMNIQEHRD